MTGQNNNQGDNAAGGPQTDPAPSDRVEPGVAEPHNPWPTRAAVIGAVAALLAALGGLAFSAVASLQATNQARIAQDSQTTERFSRSVEQLGSDSMPVRIGAIYAFDRLMQDSQVDQQAIVDILSSFIEIQAANAPVTKADDQTRRAPVDLLVALKVLDTFWKAGSRGDQPSMLLSGAHFSALAADSIKMRGSDLAGADLTYAQLRSTDLTDARLPNADLSNAHLRDSNLTRADLNQAHLNNTDLAGADLTAAQLTGAYLTGVHLTGVHLTGANLTDADLNGADLTGADLTGAVLAGADLTGVTCSATTKWPAELTPAPPCK